VRVTETIVVNQLLADIREADQRRLQTHLQMSSGRRLLRPSDDPIGVVTALRYRSALTEIKAFSANIGEARDWLETTESALRNATTILQRAREVAVTGANGTVAAGSYQALAEEVRSLRQEVILLGNSSHAGRYLFGGYQTVDPAQPPFDAAGNYQGDAGALVREIGPGVTVQINVPGDQAFAPALVALDRLANDLAAGDATAVGNDLAELDSALDGLMALRARLGAQMNRLELAQMRLQEVEVTATRLQSGAEEVDIAEVAVRLSVYENAYRVALAAAGRLLQTSLLDFLK